MRRSPEEEEVMFGKQLRLKRFFGGIVVTAAVGLVVVPAALSSTSARGGSAGTVPDVLARYVANHSGDAQQVQGYRFITDTLAGPRHLVTGTQVQPNRFTSDTIAPASGYNAGAYVHGGSTPAVAQATQQLGYGRTAAPVATTSSPSGGSSPNWKPIAIVVLSAVLLMLLLGAFRPRTRKPDTRTA
jgi:hypothetical protein